MPTATYPYKLDALRENCPLNAAIHVIRGRWKACIIDELRGGPRRFSDLRATFPGVATQTLAMQLRQLEADGIISRTVTGRRPPRVEYRMSAEGKGLLGAMEELKIWGESYLRRQG